MYSLPKLTCIETGIPAEGQYLKVVYSFKDKNVPRYTQGKTFSAILGSRSSARELFILKRDLMGPTWLSISVPTPVNTRESSETNVILSCLSFLYLERIVIRIRSHTQNAVRVDKSNMVSHCAFEFEVNHQKNVLKMADPPEVPKLKVLSLSLQTTLNSQHRNEVLLATGMLHKEVSIESGTANENKVENFSIVRTMPGKNLPLDLKSAIKKKQLKLQTAPSERALLGLLVAKLHTIDPDVIVGHDLHGFELETLLHRMQANKVPNWSLLGRLKKSNMPNLTKLSSAAGGRNFSLADAGLICGRIMCDTQVSAREFVRESTYSLTHLAESQLRVTRREIEPTETAAYLATSDRLIELLRLNENDAFLTLQLMFKLNMLPLTKTLTCLCGNIWNRSLRSARAERVEYLLLHEFHKLKFISPEKFTGREIRELKAAREDARGIVSDAPKNGNKRGKPQYSGGLVLEPKKGFYDKFVLLLDFNSLYPSIIREFNVCFTTIKHWQPLQDGQMVELPDDGSQGGVLPKVITRLIERRKAVKGLIKNERDASKKKQLDIRQLSLKLVANSMYGCLGFQSSRFFCQPLAALITSQGRDILQKTVDLTNSLGHPVIYGDTDSIMVNTNQTDLGAVRDIGKQIKKEVNRKYQILEIELDGIYKNMLLLRKKKYACLNVVERPDGTFGVVKEMKGLDLVRRDWSKLSKDVGDFVLNELLSTTKGREEVIENIHNHLTKIKEQIHNNQLPLESYIIHKGLTKAPNDYPDKQNQPHVMVALKMIADGKVVRVGDHIPYIVCKGEEGEKSIAARSYHPDAIQKANGSLVVDGTWYLSNQVLPPIARLLDPIEETDAGRIADCLGLDARKFHNFSRSTEDYGDSDDFTMPVEDDEERFKDCDRLEVECPKCSVKWELEGVFKNMPSESKPESVKQAAQLSSGLCCPTANCDGVITSLDAQLVLLCV